MKTMQFLKDVYGITEPWKFVNDWGKDSLPDSHFELTEADMLPLDEVEPRLAGILRLEVWFSDLKTKEKEILFNYYGLGQPEETAAEIGDRLEITEANVEADIKEAVKKLRKASGGHKYKLRVCLPFFQATQRAEELGHILKSRVVDLQDQLHELEAKVESFRLAAEAFTMVEIGAKNASLYDIPLYDVNLSNRTHNLLVRAGYKAVGDFYDTSIGRLRSIKGIGPKGFEEILAMLEEFGIKLQDG